MTIWPRENSLMNEAKLEGTPKQWEKVMWSEEYRFALFQTDRSTGERKEVDELMHPSSLVPTLQEHGSVFWSGVTAFGGRTISSTCPDIGQATN